MRISRAILGLRTRRMRAHFEAMRLAPRVATLEMHVRFEAIPRATRIVYPPNAFSLYGWPAVSEDRVLSDCALPLRLSRIPRGSCTLGMRPNFQAIPYSPRVVYHRDARSVWRYPACSEGCVPLECALDWRLSRMFRGSRSLGMCPHFEAIPRARRVVVPRYARSV